MFPDDLIPHLRYSVHRLCPASGWRIETRTIPDHELVLVTGGRGEVTIEGQPQAASPGMLFYFHPDLRHSLVSQNADPLQFYALHFSYARCQFAGGSWVIDPDVPLLPLRQIVTVRDYTQAVSLMQEIDRSFNRNATRPDLLSRGLFLQLLQLLLQDSRTQGFNSVSRQKIERVIEYIQQHLAGPLPLNTLASLANLSPDYLTCLFRRYTGQSPLRYIGKCRMNAAKVMLAEQNVTVRAVAATLGYQDEFYFSRSFKKIEGISPAAYSEKARLWT